MGSGGITTEAELTESLFFGGIPDDILVNILCRLDEDPRDLARLVCVSTRFCKLIKTVCWKFRCEKSLPSLVAELLQAPSTALHPCPEPPGGWASLQKLLVCCPGLWHAGVLLENWDFGLDREIGRSDDFGYPDGSSYSGSVIALESVIPELGYSHSCNALDSMSCDKIPNLSVSTSTPFTIKSHSKELATCMVVPLVNDVEAHVSCDVRGLDSVNACTQYSKQDMKCVGNAGGKDFENDADMYRNGKKVHMLKCQCNKKGFVTHMDHKEMGTDKDALEAGMKCDNDVNGIKFVNTEAEMGKCNCSATDNVMGPEHCHQSEESVSKATNKIAEECHLKGHASQYSAQEEDGTQAAMKGALQNDKSSVVQPWPELLNSDSLLNDDPLNLVSIKVSGKHQTKEDSVEFHVESSDVQLREKRVQGRKPKSHRKRRKMCRKAHCHIATRPWNLSREQGNKLLANRFRSDSLYICDWPGCSHPGDKRIYKLFRGVFKNFKHSHVWRNLKDMQAKATSMGCAFCVCKSTWDMVTTFCLKRSIEYHDDGEPVVRAYVCENGHVAGAWTDRPMYTL